MRHLLILVFVGLLGFAPVGLRSVGAQSGEDPEAWQGITVEGPVEFDGTTIVPPFDDLAEFLGSPTQNMAKGTTSIGFLLDKSFAVSFANGPGDHHAVVPEVQGAEFMVVIVDSGEFVLDVKGPGSYLVDPVKNSEIPSSADQTVGIMHASISGKEVTYTLTDQVVLDEKGNPCTNLCTVLPGVAVQVTDGDRIIAPAGAICIWCLLNQNEHASETAGTLHVFPLLADGEEFSWSLYTGDGSEVTAEQAATPAADANAIGDQLVQAVPWAFFNPAGNCRGG
jgi:hypothetical protein